MQMYVRLILKLHFVALLVDTICVHQTFYRSSRVFRNYFGDLPNFLSRDITCVIKLTQLRRTYSSQVTQLQVVCKFYGN